MADRREAILARLLEVCAALPGVTFSARNALTISAESRPAVVVYDADEDASDEDPPDRPSNAPRRVDMTPEVYVLMGERHETIGTELNAMRAALIKAVLTDATLISLVGTNGRILYDSCMTSLAPGRATEANLGIGFTFRYPLVLTEL